MGDGKRYVLAMLGVLALSVGVAAGCGDDDDDGGDTGGEASTEAEPVTEVTVTADEYTFELSDTPTADTTSITFDNQGKEPHALIFARIGEGFTVDEAFELEGKKGSAVTLVETGAGPGKSETAKVTEPIEPGEYAMLCPIGGPEGVHYKLGQLEEFSIE